MLRKRKQLSSTLAGRAAALTKSRLRRDRVELSVDGVAQSIVSLSDPTKLAYPYTRHIARAIDAAAPPGAPLRVMHLGAGALTLARFVAATRAGSPQLVVEFEPKLYCEMLAALPLPEGSDVRVIFGDAREVSDAPASPADPDASPAQEALEFHGLPESQTAVAADWVGMQFTVVDLWDAASIHPRVASREFFARVAERSDARGVTAVNVLDGHPFVYARRQAVTLGSVFDEVVVVLDADPLDPEGPLGNVVVFASNGSLSGTLEPEGLGSPRPYVLRGAQLAAWIAGASVMTDRDGCESPDPNDPRWG